MSRDLWFRLADVLLLAEHAMACNRHILTAAQIESGAPSGPALILAPAGPGVLASSGVPAWHDEHGTARTATEVTWRRRPNGRLAAPARPAPDRPAGAGTAFTGGATVHPLTRPQTFHIPLATRAEGQPRMIDLLRAGSRASASWAVINPAAARAGSLGADGILTQDHRDDLVPDGAAWKPVTLTAPPILRRHYPALAAAGYTTGDGHEIARFSRATVAEIIAGLTETGASPDSRSDPMPGEYPLLRLDGDILVESWQEEIWDGQDYQLITTGAARYLPGADGHYSLGAYTWPRQRLVPAEQSSALAAGSTR